jgi:3-isopropylmalate/(R)-2-methylmalate dehydratase small subunit
MVDLTGGYLIVDGKKLPIQPIPEFLMKIVDSGGLVEYARGLEEVPECTASLR